MFCHRLALPSWLAPVALALPLAACNMGSQSGDAPLATASSGANVVITGQPQAVSAAAGQSATLSVTAVDNAGRSLMYQWLKNNTVISGATSNSYTFVPQAGDSGASFSVVVTDQNGCLQSLYSSGTADSDGKRCVVSASATLTVTTAGLTAVAGHLGGPGNLNGAGSNARFYGAFSVTQDSAGNYFVADAFNQLIRKITPAGVVSNFAGVYATSGHIDGAGTLAEFSTPTAITIDGADNLYVADTVNNAIRKITPAGIVSTLAGGHFGCGDGTGSAATFGYPEAITSDSAGNLYVADTQCGLIREVSPAGVVTTLAHGLPQMYGIAINSSGTIYAAGNNQIFSVSNGVVTTLAGSSTPGGADGAGSTARFNFPAGMSLDASGNIYVADTFGSYIRKVTPAGVVSTVAGTYGVLGDADGTGAAASFLAPTGVFLDHSGTLLVAEYFGDVIRKINTSTAQVSTFAGLGATVGYADGSGTAATFDFLRGGDVAADGHGNLFIADTGNSIIRKIAADGTVTTLAGSPFLQGLILFPLPGNGGSSLTNGTGSAASFFLPAGLTVDASDNVYVADTGNDAIRKISPGGAVTTLAGGSIGQQDGSGSGAQFNYPTGVAVDPSGYVYVADYGNDTIRKISPTGTVITLAGSPGQAGSLDGSGTAARFNGPTHLVLDSAGNIYVTDVNNETIRKITPAGAVTTIAGSPGLAGTADGTGSAARFNMHAVSVLLLAISGAGISIDNAGNLYVADTYNGTIREVTPAGVVTTVAGTGGQVGTQLGQLPATLGPTLGVAVSGNAIYSVVESSAVLSFPLP